MGKVSLETSPKNAIIQDTINSGNSMNTTELTNTNIFKDLKTWLNYNAVFYKTFIVPMSVKQNLFVSVFVHKCLVMLNDVEYTTSKCLSRNEQLSLCYFFSINVL